MKKKIIIILGIILGFLFICIVGLNLTLSLINKQIDELMETPIANKDLSDLSDWTYIGEVNTIPIRVIVEVIIIDKQITEITIIKHRSGEGQAADAIVDDILISQSTDVDAIAGATYSSKAILLAVNKALNGEAND